ncbi:hypothetical protein QFC24_001016 [Naganishia onofrii]|uniref:Uncharacterized protein n=1 Tax=Naganishia onofrii TaxID=1851511 RepID=A0ACC2XW09_9TREE|nr:hypothetical protein QFC24_001016 [Naganishia onofrii]
MCPSSARFKQPKRHISEQSASAQRKRESKVTDTTASFLDSSDSSSDPCPGLTSTDFEQIHRYPSRTFATGGGAPHRSVLLREMIGEEEYANRNAVTVGFSTTPTKRRPPPLSSDLTIKLLRIEQSQFKWQNNRELHCVKSTSSLGKAGEMGGPCEDCYALTDLPTFRTAISREGGSIKNVHFTPKQYVSPMLRQLFLRHAQIADLFDEEGKESVALRAAELITEKWIDNADFWLASMEATVEVQRRKESGLSQKGLVRSPVLADTMHTLALLSSQAYQKVEKLFFGPTIRSFQQHRAKAPKFHLGLHKDNFINVQNFFDGLDPNEPLTLAVDDTKLLSKFRTYFEPYEKRTYLVGHTGNPIPVMDTDNLQTILDENNLEKGSKIRAYLLSSNMPKVPSYLVAAFVIGSSEKLEDLLPTTLSVLDHLGNVGLLKRLVSVTSDGYIVERNLLDGIKAQDGSRVIRTIPAYGGPFEPIVIESADLDGAPTFFPIDSKHTGKNARNAVDSGARVLVLGS